jgi:penicillin-binding protein A
MKLKLPKKHLVWFVTPPGLMIAAIFMIHPPDFITRSSQNHPPITKHILSELITPELIQGEFPSTLTQNVREKKVELELEYTIDENAQARMIRLLNRYSPDYGIFVAVDPTTGRVIVMADHKRDDDIDTNLALEARFPAASIFKIVTAAAAIDERKVTAETIIPFNGRNTTLYRQNVFSDTVNRWTRHMSVQEAFGRSVNTIFGKLGLFYAGAQSLNDYALRFGFNRQIGGDFEHGIGVTDIREEDPWTVVEAGSGYTRRTSMSPLHGALIAAAIINDGVMMEPYLVQNARLKKTGEEIYTAEPTVASVTMDALTASELKSLMEETVFRGTSRSSFRPLLNSKRFSELEVGGKTGSLTGLDPRGRNDWFVGYASMHGHQVAFAALTVNRQYWQVRSATLARLFIEDYFRNIQDPTQVVTSE